MEDAEDARRQFGLRVQSQGGKGILKTIPRTAEAFAKNVSNKKIGIDDDDSSPDAN